MFKLDDFSLGGSFSGSAPTPTTSFPSIVFGEGSSSSEDEVDGDGDGDAEGSTTTEDAFSLNVHDASGNGHGVDDDGSSDDTASDSLNLTRLSSRRGLSRSRPKTPSEAPARWAPQMLYIQMVSCLSRDEGCRLIDVRLNNDLTRLGVR